LRLRRRRGTAQQGCGVLAGVAWAWARSCGAGGCCLVFLVSRRRARGLFGGMAPFVFPGVAGQDERGVRAGFGAVPAGEAAGRRDLHGYRFPPVILATPP